MALSFFFFFFTIHQLNKRRNLYTNISKHNNNGLKGQMIFKGIYIPPQKNDVRKPYRLRSNASTYWLQRELQLKTLPEQVRIHSETRSNSKYDETFDVAFLVF